MVLMICGVWVCGQLLVCVHHILCGVTSPELLVINTLCDCAGLWGCWWRGWREEERPSVRPSFRKTTASCASITTTCATSDLNSKPLFQCGLGEVPSPLFCNAVPYNISLLFSVTPSAVFTFRCSLLLSPALSVRDALLLLPLCAFCFMSLSLALFLSVFSFLLHIHSDLEREWKGDTVTEVSDFNRATSYV